ncbi:MAG TPA: KH domain-containing protein [Thermoanaerobaculia bacterium]|nr:KH domain-containing protein [Thermoanaerobaculia bacterium]
MSRPAELLEEIVRGLVDRPDQVAVEEEDVGESVVLHVRVDPDEIGRVIGRQGRTVKALRTLLELRSSDGVYYELEVDE